VSAMDARLAVARELFEGARPTARRLALLGNWLEATVETKIRTQTWKRPPATRKEMQARVHRRLEKRLDELLALEEAGGKVTPAAAKARTDECLKIDSALRAALRGGDRGEEPQQEQAENNAELAGLLQKIDDRIFELARHFAAEMVAGNRETGIDSASERGVGPAGALPPV
jgi:hypothetical protein